LLRAPRTRRWRSLPRRARSVSANYLSWETKKTIMATAKNPKLNQSDLELLLLNMAPSSLLIVPFFQAATLISPMISLPTMFNNVIPMMMRLMMFSAPIGFLPLALQMQASPLSPARIAIAPWITAANGPGASVGLRWATIRFNEAPQLGQLFIGFACFWSEVK
jgi:hypothetical protein